MLQTRALTSAWREFRRILRDECFGASIPQPVSVAGQIVNPFTHLNNAVDLARNVTKVGGSKQVLVTACDAARSLCKPVDDLVGKKTYSYQAPQSNYFQSREYHEMMSTLKALSAAASGPDAAALAAKAADTAIEVARARGA